MTDEVAISYFIRHASMHLQKVYLEKKLLLFSNTVLYIHSILKQNFYISYLSNKIKFKFFIRTQST